MWTEFRAACDAFFARRQQQRDEETAQLNAWRQGVSALLTEVGALELTSLTESQLREHLQQLNDVDTADDKALRQQQQQLRQHLTGQLAALQKQAEAGQYQQLFSALAKPDVQAADLPALYRLVFNQQQETMSRADLTLALEWAAGQPSPTALAGARQRVQMQLLSDKHNSGDNLSQNELLGRWLQHGPLQADDADLLARVRVFVSGLMPVNKKTTERWFFLCPGMDGIVSQVFQHANNLACCLLNASRSGTGLRH